jgi:hypothetical protein
MKAPKNISEEMARTFAKKSAWNSNLEAVPSICKSTTRRPQGRPAKIL